MSIHYTLHAKETGLRHNVFVIAIATVFYVASYVAIFSVIMIL